MAIHMVDVLCEAKKGLFQGDLNVYFEVIAFSDKSVVFQDLDLEVDRARLDV